MFVPTSEFLLFVYYAVAHGEECSFLAFFGLLFALFLQILPELKNSGLGVHIIPVLDATFVPNLTFLGLLSPEISLAEKLVTHPPSLFRDP